MNQASGDRQILAKQLNISPYQLSYVTNSGEGEGLLFYGNIIIPFKDRFNKNLKLYELMTTKPSETVKRDEKNGEKTAGPPGGAESVDSTDSGDSAADGVQYRVTRNPFTNRLEIHT